MLAEEDVEGFFGEEMWCQEREGSVEVIRGSRHGDEGLEGFGFAVDGDEEGEGCGV